MLPLGDPYARIPLFRDNEPVIGSSAGDAIMLGRWINPRDGVDKRLRYGGDQHVVLIGPNGKGKGSGILIPNLMHLRQVSMVVTDTKGDLAAVTAPYRRSLGRVVVINPFGMHTQRYGYHDLKSWGFNPLAHLRPDDSFDPDNPGETSLNAQAALLADALIPVDSNIKEPHWPMSGRALLAAIIMHVVMTERRAGRVPTMAKVRALICQASEARHKDMQAIGLPKLADEMMRSGHVGLANKASQFWDFTREVQSIASVVKIETEPFDDPQISYDMDQEGFDFSSIKSIPTTVYIMLPPLMVARHKKWLRLILTAALQSVMHPRELGEYKTVFMLDEFFSLGYLNVIESLWAHVRGYGIQMLPVLHDLGQLKKLYSDTWRTILGNAGVVLSYAANDDETGDWLCKQAGETQRSVKTLSESLSKATSFGSNSGSSSGGRGSFNEGSSHGTSYTDSTTANTSLIKAPLITAHTLRGLKPGFMVGLVDGHKNMVPIYAPSYLQVDELERRVRPDPYNVNTSRRGNGPSAARVTVIGDGRGRDGAALSQLAHRILQRGR